MVSDNGEWLRTQALIMAKNWSTPVSFWLSITLRELRDWIDSSNETLANMKNNR